MKYNLHLIKFAKFKSTVQYILANAYSYLTITTTKRAYFHHSKIFLGAHFPKSTGAESHMLAFSWAQMGKI